MAKLAGRPVRTLLQSEDGIFLFHRLTFLSLHSQSLELLSKNLITTTVRPCFGHQTNILLFCETVIVLVFDCTIETLIID